MHTSIHSGSTGIIRHPPRNGFTASSALSPGTTALLTPSSARRVGVLANLTPASGRQNHTASPSATASARLTLRRVHRIPPDVRDDREPPLLARRDGQSKPHISGKRKQIIFRARAGQEFASPARRANHLTQDGQEQAASQRFLDFSAGSIRRHSGAPHRGEPGIWRLSREIPGCAGAPE